MWPKLKLLLLYSIPIILTFAFERSADYLSDASPGTRGAIQTLLTSATISYQRFTTFGYRPPRSHYVRIVSFDQDKEPARLFANLCQKRLLYSRAIDQIAAADPAMMVIDARFGDSTCPADDPGTIKLKESVVKAVRAGVPVVVGLDSLNREEWLVHHGGTPFPADKEELLLKQGLDFGVTSPLLMFGLVRLNSDVRKIPLYWPTLVNSAQDNPKPVQVPTLSFVTAGFYDSLLQQQPRMKDLLAHKKHPYSSFIVERNFPTYDVLDIVCGLDDQQRTSDWANCPLTQFGRTALRAHIVVLGERIEAEMRDSVVGAVPGFVLQSNYIESLLDDRYFLPVSGWVQILVSLVLFAVIEIAFKKTQSPQKAVGISLAAIAASWVLSWLLLVLFGRFVIVWLPGLIALLAKYADSKMEKKEVRHASA